MKQQIRLSDHDLNAILSCFQKHFLKNDRLWIFGSRTDLSKKGGDIDLYIETHAQTIEQALKMRDQFLDELEENIGEQKIDSVLNILHHPHPLNIHEVAKAEGVRVL